MKLRTVLLITLALTTINGGILVYRHLHPPSTPPASVTAPTSPATPADRAPPATTVTPPDQVATLETKPHPPKLPDHSLPPIGVADWILVEKKARRLTLFRNNRPLKSYAIALGRQPEGPKRFQGDNKTPEGRYRIASRKQNSDFHRALRISYPSPEDAAFAAKQKRSAGGDIMIHGLPNGMGSLGRLHLLRDWTAGCIAVTNAEIEELWRAVPDGTPIEIRP
ncbi:MAG: L,D-transpeptidase family protein [Candidatus Competibacter sp.]|nr:L,D-transpeptidase family protein [Candidatus Competibacter sp.]